MSLYALLLTIAVVLVVMGIIQVARRSYLWGAGLIGLALLIGPGGVSIFR